MYGWLRVVVEWREREREGTEGRVVMDVIILGCLVIEQERRPWKCTDLISPIKQASE